MSIESCSTEHMLVDFFIEYFQGYIFVKLRDVIMGWKHIYTPQMKPPLTKERVENVDEVDSRTKENKKYTGNKICTRM